MAETVARSSRRTIARHHRTYRSIAWPGSGSLARHGPCSTSMRSVGRRNRAMTTGQTASVTAQRDPATSGLEGIVAARTELSDVDGQKGILTIRGYDVEELAGQVSLEEAAHLLWHGKLPTQSELDDLQKRLVGYRRLPEET